MRVIERRFVEKGAMEIPERALAGGPGDPYSKVSADGTRSAKCCLRTASLGKGAG